MTGFQTFVFVVNMMCVLAAIVVNVWAAYQIRNPIARWTYGTIGFLGIVYAMGYVWVLRTGDVVAWSEFFRGVSPSAWLLVWVWPSASAVLRERRDAVKISRLAERHGANVSSTDGDG